MKEKKIIIKTCDDCPFFIPSWASNCRNSCIKANMRVTPTNPDTGKHDIPDACDLEDNNEK